MTEPTAVVAPNPGPMTGPGTNQWLVPADPPLLIDVAALDAENARRLAAAGPPVGRLLLTHVHVDHVGGAGALREATGAAIAVHRSRRDFAFAGRPLAPDVLVADGDEIPWAGGRLRAFHTPGHDSGHVCWHEPERGWLFTGDTVLGTGTTVIPPPDGDMAAYLASLRRLETLRLTRLFPGHGPPLDRPYEILAALVAHRLMRERQVLDGIGGDGATIADLVRRLYADVPTVLHGAAGLTVRAHLDKLVTEGEAVEGPAGYFRRAGA